MLEHRSQGGATEHEPQRDRDDLASARNYNFRLLLFFLVVVLSLYCFGSQVAHKWGPSPVDDRNTAVSREEWQKVVDLCHGDVGPLSPAEERTLAVFELAGGLAVYLFTLWQVPRRFRARRRSTKVALREVEAAVENGSSPRHNNNRSGV